MLRHSKAAGVVVLGLVGFVAFVSTAEAVPIRVSVGLGGNKRAAIKDVNWDAWQGGGYQVSASDLASGRVQFPSSQSGSGIQKFENQVSVGFSIPRPDELADPLRGEWHRDNSPEDVVLVATGHGALSWGGMPYREGGNLTAEFTPDTKADFRIDPLLFPPDLLNLIRHPERITISGASAWQSGGYGSQANFGFRSRPAPEPTPVPEPAALTTFGLILGGLLWHQRRARSRDSKHA